MKRKEDEKSKGKLERNKKERESNKGSLASVFLCMTDFNSIT